MLRSKLVAALLSTLLAVCTLATASPTTVLDPRTRDAVTMSYDLLLQTFYRPVDAKAIYAGAERGIEIYDKLHRKAAPAILRVGTATSSGAILQMISENTIATTLPADEVASAAISGMAASVHDRWTVFLSAQDLAAFRAPIDPPSIFGVGILLQPDAASRFVRALFVIPNGPADRAGLESGDLITEVGGISTKGLAQPVVSRMLRGNAGSQVAVTYRLPDGRQRSAIVTRESVRVPTVLFSVLPGTSTGYVFISAFGEPTGKEFSAALERLRGRTNALIVDLRDDGGGYVSAAVSVASHFIDSGPIVTSIGRDGGLLTQESDDESPQLDVPTVVLVNKYTASASEIAAGALQDSGVATLIGTRTFGKGVEQSLTRLPDGSAIKITTARYLTPSNRDLNTVGLRPDVFCATKRGDVLGDPERDSELQCAMTYIAKHAKAP